jgi:hypothetical protein
MGRVIGLAGGNARIFAEPASHSPRAAMAVSAACKLSGCSSCSIVTSPIAVSDWRVLQKFWHFRPPNR